MQEVNAGVGRRDGRRVEAGAALSDAVLSLSDADLPRELNGILPAEELAGLAIRLRVTITKLADWIGRSPWW